jgi:glutathionyl-hydroquinone reductase
VNNESSEIIRILNSAFDEFLDEKHAKRDFYPEPLRGKIDEVNEWVYDLFNNGVYKTGFASLQTVCPLPHRQPC